MIIGKFETKSSAAAIEQIIHEYRVGQYGVPEWRNFDDDLSPREMGVIRTVIDSTPRAGRVHVKLSRTPSGTTGVEIFTEVSTNHGDANVSPEQYARELVAEIQARMIGLAAPLVIESEDDLRKAFYAINQEQGTPEWWREIAALYHRHRRANPKYTYGELTRLLGYKDEKNTGAQIRKYPPETT